MFLAALLINVFGIIFAMLLFYHYAVEYFYDEYTESLSERVYIGAKNADVGFQQIYREVLDISFDERIIELLSSDDPAALSMIAARLKEYREKNLLADSIYCYLPATHILLRSDEYNSVQKLDESTALKWQEIINRQQGMNPVFAANILSSSEKEVFIYKDEIKYPQMSAYITAQISERALYYAYLDDIGNSDKSIVIMFDDKGNLVSQSRYIESQIANDMWTAIQQSNSVLNVRLNNENFLGAHIKMPLSQYTVLLLVNKKMMESKMVFMQAVSVLSVIIILIFSMIVLGHMAKLVMLKRQAELNALQYQIRPHFIYNTLNSIRFAALMQGAKNIGELLADFIDLLQVSTNRKGTFATLSVEIDTLKHYIALQEFRLMDSFAVEFDLSEETLNCIVPRLILQPFVENSIIHAPSPEKSFCHINISSKIQEDQLVIEVKDDGKGMSAETIAALDDERATDKKAHGGFSSIGIANVRERLHIHYGDKSSVIYESDGKSYTKVSIILPISHDVNEYKLR